MASSNSRHASSGRQRDIRRGNNHHPLAPRPQRISNPQIANRHDDRPLGVPPNHLQQQTPAPRPPYGHPQAQYPTFTRAGITAPVATTAPPSYEGVSIATGAVPPEVMSCPNTTQFYQQNSGPSAYHPNAVYLPPGGYEPNAFSPSGFGAAPPTSQPYSRQIDSALHLSGLSWVPPPNLVPNMAAATSQPPFGAVYPSPAQDYGAVPPHQHQGGPSNTPPDDPLTAFSDLPTGSYYSDFGHVNPVAVPGASQSFDISTGDENVRRYFSGMLIEHPRHSAQPRVLHERAEAESIWGQEQYDASGQQPPIVDSIAHAGEHLFLDPRPISATQPPPTIQFIQQDGKTQPPATGRTGTRRGPSDPAATKKTRKAGACISCQVRKGSKQGTCAFDGQRGDPCPPCVKFFGENASKYCVRIPTGNVKEFLPFEMDASDATPPPPAFPHLDGNLGEEDLTVYLTTVPSTLTASPTAIFRPDGSSTLPLEPLVSYLKRFTEDNFVVEINLGRALRLDDEENNQIRDLEMCACYLLVISKVARAEYRTELSPNHIAIAQHISQWLLRFYFSKYSETFKSLFKRSVSWMKSPRKEGMRRNVATWVMCGLFKLAEYQTTIIIPSPETIPATDIAHQSSIPGKLVALSGQRLTKIKNLAQFAVAEVMNKEKGKPLKRFEEFVSDILPKLTGPDITIAHATTPSTSLDHPNTPPATVGLRGDTNPFNKSGVARVSDFLRYPGDTDIATLFLNTDSSAPTRDSPISVHPPAAQSDSSQPGNFSIATQLDLEFDYAYNLSDDISSLPLSPLSFPNEPAAPVGPSIMISSTDPASNDLGASRAASGWPDSSLDFEFEDQCLSSGDESGGVLRLASRTEGAEGDWCATSEETDSSY
ncbi:hypothetical protein FGG08_004275 [Glutinoglossum americanum]|uniref:Uncharacterized protein n=1 Tax=Glutinoglossum americanum TaxID=1670608 RepID=A0A9P8I5L4_9PEZI|nr:hypothetical protein FGG08_004275 [Glutinoglossum americanum]